MFGYVIIRLVIYEGDKQPSIIIVLIMQMKNRSYQNYEKD